MRYETFEQARNIGLLIRESYESPGYQVMEIPRMCVGDRVKFVREVLEQL